ncbi:MAG: hypothetical protein GY716_23885 [bacterium]|nr:hypothetical protein [bacterium]
MTPRPMLSGRRRGGSMPALRIPCVVVALVLLVSSASLAQEFVDLSLTHSFAGVPPFESGESIQLTMQLTNALASVATGVRVQLYPPPGIEFTGVATDGGAGTSYDAEKGIWSATVSGESTLTIDALVLAVGDLVFEAEIIAVVQPDVDSVPGNGTMNGEDDEAVFRIPVRQTVRVDASCPAAPGDGSEASPFCAIQDAVNSVETGRVGRVLVAAGSYAECVDGTGVAAGLQLEALESSVLTLIEPGSNCNDGEAVLPTVRLVGDSSIVGFTVRGGDASAIRAEGGVRVLFNRIEGGSAARGGGLALFTRAGTYAAANATIEGNLFSGNGALDLTDDTGLGGGLYLCAGVGSCLAAPDGCSAGDVVVTVAGNTFVDNTAGMFGGGAAVETEGCDSGDSVFVSLSNNVFEQNAQLNSDGWGGGLLVRTLGTADEQIVVSGNSFSQNHSTGGAGGLSAWALPGPAASRHRLDVSDNEIRSNTAAGSGAGLDLFVLADELDSDAIYEVFSAGNTIVGNVSGERGGGVLLDLDVLKSFELDVGLSEAQEFRFENNIVTDNHAALGGGGVLAALFADSDPDSDPPGDCRPIARSEAEMEFVGNLVARNSSGGDGLTSGGGLLAFVDARGDALALLDVSLSTIVENTAPDGGVGGLELDAILERECTNDFPGQGRLRVDSTLIAFNSGVGYGGPGRDAGASASIVASDVFGNEDGDYGEGYPDVAGGNISADPLFLDRYRVPRESPVVESGNASPLVGVPAEDFEGDPRVVDGDNDPPARVDIGYDEFFCSAPTVLDVEPDDGAGGVSAASVVTVTFCSGVDISSINPDTLLLLDETGVALTYNVEFDEDNRIVSLLPLAPLLHGQLHTIEVTDGVLGQSEEAAVPFTSNFRVQDTVELPDTATQLDDLGPGSLTGSSVAGTGDLDGDGDADFVAGAPGAEVAGRTAAGSVGVYISDGLRPDIIFEGEREHDRAGVSVAGGFDYNGDERPDLLIGAEQVDRSLDGGAIPAGAGKAYLIFFDPDEFDFDKDGTPDYLVDAPLRVPLSLVGTTISGVVFEGEQPGDRAGFSVAGGGLMDVDDLPDIAIGAPGAGERAGKVYVVFDQELPAVVDLFDVSGAIEGYQFLGEFAGDQVGHAVAFVGDVLPDTAPSIRTQGEGTGELAIGAPGVDPRDEEGKQTTDAGAGFFVQGKQLDSGQNPMCVIGDPETDPKTSVGGTVVIGEQGGEAVGFGMAGGAGANDTQNDSLIGAPGFDTQPDVPGVETDEGRVIQTVAQLPLGTVTPTQISLPTTARAAGSGALGTIWTGEGQGHRLGSAVAGLGDVTGEDGLGEIALGAPFFGENAEGAVYLIRGTPTGYGGEKSVAEVGGAVPGTVLTGASADERAGSAIAAGGDVTGNGTTDFLVGSPTFTDEGRVDAGAVYIVDSICGDGVVDVGEACDDGGVSTTCNVNCTLATCGDAILNDDAGEECDDGNLLNGDDCDAACRIELPCPDNDGDTWVVCDAQCDAGPGSACGDCDDLDATSFPGAEQLCDGLNNDCADPAWPAVPTDEADADGDGVSSCAGDCDDAADAIFPGAPAVCDGVNNDCDDPLWPGLPASEADADGDGVSACAGDCDDANAAVLPGGKQVCDRLNNDCNDPTWPVAPAEDLDADADGFAVCAGDCDDAAAETYPGADELCDETDNDCNGAVDDSPKCDAVCKLTLVTTVRPASIDTDPLPGCGPDAGALEPFALRAGDSGDDEAGDESDPDDEGSDGQDDDEDDDESDDEDSDEEPTEPTSPRSLNFRYTGAGCAGSENDQVGAACSGTVDRDAAVRVVARAASLLRGLGGAEYMVIPDTVAAGDEFMIFSPDGELDPATVVELSNDGGTEVNRLDTSCRQGLHSGDSFGSLTLSAFDGEEPTRLPVTYGYELRNDADTVFDIVVEDDRLGTVGSGFDLERGETHSLTAEAEVIRTTTSLATASGVQLDGELCEASDETTVTVVQQDVPGGIEPARPTRRLRLRYVGASCRQNDAERARPRIGCRTRRSAPRSVNVIVSDTPDPFDGSAVVYYEGGLNAGQALPLAVGPEHAGAYLHVLDGRGRRLWTVELPAADSAARGLEGFAVERAAP